MNSLLRTLGGILGLRASPPPGNPAIYADALRQHLSGAGKKSDISDHLGPLFFFACCTRPKLIVELGTRGGESTRALLAAASVSDARLLSIDIADCRIPDDMPSRSRWSFVQCDDVMFARKEFSGWCDTIDIPRKVDVLFVDTSHEYAHTKDEIKEWAPFLSPHGIMVFHDTHMGRGRYTRLDGSSDAGWDNNRGVIRAIEELMGKHYDESVEFVDSNDSYHLLHFPHCNGLTILAKR